MADEITRIVTQLVVDAVGAKSGVADFEAAMAKARAAAEAGGTSVKSFDSAQKQWTNSLAATDPVLKAQIRMMDALEKQSGIGTKAVQLGITTQAAHEKQLEAVRTKFQGYVTAAERAAFANTTLGKASAFLTSQMMPMLGILSAAAVIGFATARFRDAAALKEEAEQITTGVEALQAYRAAFMTNGVAVEAGAALIQKLSRNIGIAKDTAGPARAAFMDLGVAFSDLSSTEGGISKTAAQLLAMTDANERARLETVLFGKSGMQLEPVLRSLAQPLDVLIAKAKEAGLVIDEDLATKADDAADRMALAWAKLNVTATPTIVRMMEAVGDLVDNLDRLSQWQPGSYVEMLLRLPPGNLIPALAGSSAREMAGTTDADIAARKAESAAAARRFASLPGNLNLSPDISFLGQNSAVQSQWSLKGTGIQEDQNRLLRERELSTMDAASRAGAAAVYQRAELVRKSLGDDALIENLAQARKIVDEAAAAQGTWTSKQIESVAAATAQASAYQKIRMTFEGYLDQLGEEARMAGLSSAEREQEQEIIKGAQVWQKANNTAEKDLVQTRDAGLAILQKSGHAQEVLAVLAEKRDAQLRLQNQRGQDNLDILNTEIALIGASNLERAVTLAQLHAEQELKARYGASFDAAAPTAEQQKAIDLAKGQAAAQVALATATDLYNASLTFQLDLLDEIDSSARSAASGMADAFGNVGKAIGDVAVTMTGYAALQEKFRVDEAARIKAGTNDWKAQTLAARSAANAEDQFYGDMLSAAKGFFGEKTAAYKMLQAVEGTYNAFRLAGNIQAMLSDQAAVASKAATVPAIVGANASIAASGVTAGAAQIFAQLGWWGFPVVAAMLAVMAGLGFAGGSGGAPKVDTTAKDRQAAQGAGSVMGDAAAKSDSISKSLDTLAKNTNKDLEYSSQMVSSLKAIQEGIGTASSLLARQLNLNGALNTSDLGLGTSSRPGASGLAGVVGWSGAAGMAPGDPLGTLVGFLGGQFGKTKTTSSLQDQGISFDASGAGNFYQQIEVAKRSTALFGLIASTKTSVNTLSNALPSELQAQISLIINGLRSTIVEAATKLGVDGASAAIDAFAINIGSISLKDMSGAEIQDALNSVFSKLGDDMASTAAPFLSSLQKVGEGSLETLSRLVNEVMVVGDAMKSMGLTFNLVGRDSIAASDCLVRLSGDLDTFASQSQFFVDNFLTSAQALAPIQRAVADEMARLGVGGIAAKDQFAALVQGLDVSTESGAQLYTALMNVAPAFAKVADAAADLAARRMDMEISLLQATGDVVGATALQRQKELASLDSSLVSLQQQIYAAQDLKAANDNLTAANEEAARVADAAATASAALSARRQDLEITLLQATGDTLGATAKQRERELAALDASLRPLQQEIYAAQDLRIAFTEVGTGIDALVQTANDAASAAQNAANTWGGAHDALTKASRALLISDQSLSPQQQYANAGQQFDQLRASAMAGDAGAANDLASFASQFLQSSYQYNAATTAYGQDFSYVQRTLADVADFSANKQSLMQQQADSLKTTVKLLQDLKDRSDRMVENTASFAEMKDAITKLAAKVDDAMRQGRLAA